MFFYNKEKNKQKATSLANALANPKVKGGNSYSTSQIPTLSGYASKEDTSSNGSGLSFNDLKGIYDDVQKFRGLGGAGSSSGAIGSAANNYISGTPSYGTVGNAANSYISGAGASGSSSALSGAINSEVGSGAASSGGGFSGGGSVPWALIGSGLKAGYNGYTGQDDTDYSDTEESIVYPLQGASVGASFGPWGALGGALYGLGYSLKDDIGLKDNNWLTTILLPIGMGDEHEGLIQL